MYARARFFGPDTDSAGKSFESSSIFTSHCVVILKVVRASFLVDTIADAAGSPFVGIAVVAGIVDREI